MFNIIETFQNYFTCELQSQQWSGTSLQRKLVAAMFGGKLFGGSVFANQCSPVMPAVEMNASAIVALMLSY